MRHGLLEQSSQLLPLRLQLPRQARSQHQHPRLRDGALDQVVDVLRAEPQLLQAGGLVAQVGEEPPEGVGQHLAGGLALDVADIDAEALGGLEVAVRVRRGGELEDGGRGDGHGDAVRDDGRGHLVAGVPVAWVLARDGVGHAWREILVSLARSSRRMKSRSP